MDITREKLDKKTICHRLEAHDIERRNPSEAHTIYPRCDFSGDPLEKAYLQGFRLGDLNVRMAGEGPECATIVVSCSTTHAAQVNLIRSLFSSYAQVTVSTSQDGRYSVTCDLNLSFDFLLSKQDSMPGWVVRAANQGDMQPAVAFLGGYTDAEGAFHVRPNSKDAYFSLSSYDLNTLRQLHALLNAQLSVICPPLYLAKPKGSPIQGKNGKIYFSNDDLWRINVYRKASLDRLCELLEPYLRHTEKQTDMYAVWANVRARGL